MEKKPYIQPTLVDRGKIAEETMQNNLPSAVEIDGVTKTDGMAI